MIVTTMTMITSSMHCFSVWQNHFLVMNIMIMITIMMPMQTGVIVMILLGIPLDVHADNVYGDVDDDDDAPLVMTRVMVVRVVVSISTLYSLYNIESFSCPL